ncbi:MAG: response regulator [Treponema sp.]|jgi:signal transduction histidine kinase/CheY-like chemotaxis protein|nr:response regulator [Treponema sp.]
MKKGKFGLSKASFISFVSAIMIVVVSVVVTVYMNRTVKMVETATQNHLLAAARAASTFITAEELDLFHDEGDMERPEWESIRARLQQFAEDYQVLYVYYWRVYGDAQIQYIIDNDDDPEEMSTPEMIFDIDADEDPSTAEAVPLIMAGNPWVSDLGTYTYTWDGVISGIAPVFNADGSVYCAAGVDISDEIIIIQQNNMKIMRLVLFFALILSIVSGFMGMLSYRRKAIQSESANRAKSQFLSTMSHEIRTPLNAIIGMGELALRSDNLPQITTYVHEIKRAGVTLLSLVNDLLDLSKIEAGKLEIIPVSYNLASLINDVTNIIKTRIADKPIRLFMNIDPNLPSGLNGDEVRIRQILINLLGNAVKYCAKGFIGLTITSEKKESGKVYLRIDVSDSGFGIRPEDMNKLFLEFGQVDIVKNRGIEGTGLGLTITKRLCAAMGGDLMVSSVYGKGSVFTAYIPQNIDSALPLAAVEQAGQKPVLIYEQRLLYANSITWSLDKLGVPCVHTADENEFLKTLKERDWYYVFAGLHFRNFVHAQLNAMEKKQANLPLLALMTEQRIELPASEAWCLTVPAHTPSLANTLNGIQDSQIHYQDTDSHLLNKFTAPDARLLVVDDNAVNLQVAQGLLAPYQSAVDICTGGEEAVELVKSRSYDIVFMDHMMPGMDGIEATALIRAWEQERSGARIPIVALTADAISGMKEMFLSKGFDDFISKPVDVSRLDEILIHWIPKEKKLMNKDKKIEKIEIAKKVESPAQPSVSSLPAIPGLDMQKGIAMTGRKEAVYLKVLAMFHKDAPERLSVMQKAHGSGDLSAFVINAHSMKSVLASIGAAEISAEAAGLEAAGKAGNLTLIGETLPGFAQRLTELADNVRSGLGRNDM